MSDSDTRVIDRRRDFVLFFDVQDGNPNGDPDAGNLPRVDPENGHGLVTDVCIKRKIRNYVLAAKGGLAPFEIYVMERSVLNQQHARGYDAQKIALVEPAEDLVPNDVDASALVGGVPEGFEVEEGEDDGTFVSRYDGTLDATALKAALKQIKEQFGQKAHAHFVTLSKKAKGRKATEEDRGRVRGWMCDTFFDVRCFGAVMSTKVDAGQVRGPVQLTFARSADPIIALEHSITRMAVTTANEADYQRGGNRTMARKATVPYGLYRAHGFVSPALAERAEGRRVQGTGFSEADLALLWEALETMFEHDRSAARGLMSTRALVIFEHDSRLGSHPAHALFERVRATRKTEVARSFDDYELSLDGKKISGVRTVVKVAPSLE
jgi:CRISPR-associated protein Csd2